MKRLDMIVICAEHGDQRKMPERIAESFIIDINWDCNLQCRMCVKRTLNCPYGQRPLKDFKTLVEKIPFAKAIKMGALGDPFSYKQIKELLHYLKGKVEYLPLTTNVTQITPDNLEWIPKGTPLYLSIDAGTPEVYKKIRNSDLAKTKAKVRFIREQRPDIPMSINYLMFNFNILDAKPLLDFCKELDISITFFYPIYFTKELEKEWSIFRKEQYVVDMLDAAKYAEKLGVKYAMSSPFLEERPCSRAFQEPIVAYDGTVYPCDYCYQNMNDYTEWNSWYLGKPTKVPQQEYAMGNLYKDDFVDMWNSDKWIKLRELLTDLNRYGTGMNYQKTMYSLKGEQFDHCKICLARWNRCL